MVELHQKNIVDVVCSDLEQMLWRELIENLNGGGALLTFSAVMVHGYVQTS